METLSLGVVVTNYNTWDIALRCVEKVLVQGAAIDRVVLHDDASTIPRPPAIDSRVELVVNRANLGLVKTLNLAIAGLDTDLVVLFDSDAYPLHDFTAPVRDAFLADPKLAIAGFATVDRHGRATGSAEPEPGQASLVLGQRLHALWLRWFPRGGSERLCVYTCAMAIRRRAFEELGGFDERLDWLDLDHDLCMNAWRRGWKVAILPGAVAFHEGSGTPQKASHRVLRFYKARWLLLTKYGKIRFPTLVRWAVAGRLSLEALFLRLGRWIYPDRRSELDDKLQGRRAVIRYCREHYR